MAKTTWTKEEFWAELEGYGEDEVRVRIASKLYSDVNEKAGLAREWLHRKTQEREREREARNEASNLEQVRIARSAKNAAWAAAIAAIIAAMFAVISVFLNQ